MNNFNDSDQSPSAFFNAEHNKTTNSLPTSRNESQTRQRVQLDRKKTKEQEGIQFTTKAEIQKFQRENGLEPDGIIGRKTRAALAEKATQRETINQPRQRNIFENIFPGFNNRDSNLGSNETAYAGSPQMSQIERSRDIPYNSIVNYRGRTLGQKVTPKLEGTAQELLASNPEIKAIYDKVPWGFEKGFLRLVSNIKARGMEPKSNFVFVVNRIDNRSAIAWIPSKGRFITANPGSCVFGNGYGNVSGSNSTPLGTSQLRDIKLMDDPNKVAAFSGDPRSPIRGLNGRKQGLETMQTKYRNLDSFNYGLNSSMGNSNNAARLIQFHGGPASIGCTSYTDSGFMQTLGKEIIRNFQNNIPAFEENAIG